MSAADAAIAAAPPDATELRIIRYRVRPSAGQAASEWLGDAALGGDDGPSDGARPLRTATVHWTTSEGATVPFDLADGDDFTPDDIARLLGAARQRNLRCGVWVETARLGGGSMHLAETWFSAADDGGATVDHELADVRPTVDGVVVTVDERVPPNRGWLLFFPVMLVTFAWVFFLVLGALPRMLRETWQRAMHGVGQRCVVTLDAHALRFDVARAGQPRQVVEIDRADLLAVGTSMGFWAYTRRGAIALPNEWATPQLTDQREIRSAVAAAINRSIGAA